MSSASIIITQSGVAGQAGRSRKDIVTGDPVTLSNLSNAGVRSWRWTLVDAPEASTVTLTNPSSAVASFTPDVPGSYLVELVVDEGRTGQVDRRVVAIEETVGSYTVRFPAAGEEDEANWDDGSGSPNRRGWMPDIRTALYAALLSTVAAAPTGPNTILRSDGSTWVESTSVTVDASGNLGVTGSAKVANSSGTAHPNADDVTVGTAGDAANYGLTIFASSTSYSIINFGDEADSDVGYIQYQHNSDAINFGTAATLRLRLSSGGLWPHTDNALPNGLSGNRWSTIWGYDLDLADDANIAGDLTVAGVGVFKAGVSNLAATGNGDDFEVGDSSVQHQGMTLHANSTGRFWKYYADEASNSGGWEYYDHVNNRFYWGPGSTSTLFLGATELSPNSDNTVAAGRTSLRYSTVYAYDLDLADDATIAGDLTATGLASIISAGNNSSTSARFENRKTDGGVSYHDWYSNGFLRWRWWHGTGESFSLARYDSGGSFADYQIQCGSSGGLTIGASGQNAEFSGYLHRSTAAGITASTVQSQGQQPLTADVNQISVCANANDVVTLPAAAAGRVCIVLNYGAQTLQIFPASGDSCGNGTDNSVTLAGSGNGAVFAAYNTSVWCRLV